MRGLMYSATNQSIINLLSVEDYDLLSGEVFNYNSCFDERQKPYDVARTSIMCFIYSYLFMDYPLASMFLNRYRPLSGYISTSRYVSINTYLCSFLFLNFRFPDG